MDRMSSRTSSPVLILLTIIIVLYAGIGTSYAVLTPVWQVPDEPAHYNYVRSLAEGRGFPVLEKGDYDQAYLRQLTSEGFPAELSVESLEYEGHQPPLYYLLATPIYLLSDGATVALRLFSVLLGAGLLVIAFGAVRTIFPTRPELALMAAAFVAFIPQHSAMTAGVNNDVLAEVAVGGTLWALIGYVRAGWENSSELGARRDRPWHVGLLLAGALLTKTTAYVVVGVAVGAVVIRGYRERREWSWTAGQLAWMLVPALLLSAPWFIRNGLTYGWHDPLGLARHDAVVQGQPRTYEWLADFGWIGLIKRLIVTTFQSFWGQFGWMAVPLPRPFYQGLAVLSVVLMAGFFVWLIDRRRAYTTGPLVSHPISLLALSALFTFLAYGWYNLSYVQHQGRYLYPALIPLATAVALGLDTVSRLLPEDFRPWVLEAFFVSLAVFDGYCLFRIILPNL
jgi:4-amino-4-deoxy-L-arabinose transferase-like glycosyltransferase